jgi:hypothetical protein
MTKDKKKRQTVYCVLGQLCKYIRIVDKSSMYKYVFSDEPRFTFLSLWFVTILFLKRFKYLHILGKIIVKFFILSVLVLDKGNNSSIKYRKRDYFMIKLFIPISLFLIVNLQRTFQTLLYIQAKYENRLSVIKYLNLMICQCTVF